MKSSNAQKFQALGWIVLSLNVAFGASALAQSNQTQATVEKKSTWDSVKEKLRLQYIGEFGGPSLTNAYNPAPDGTADDPINLNNKIAAGYRFNKAWLADATVTFNYAPFGKKATEINPNNGTLGMGDMFLRVQNVSVLGNLLLVSDLRSYLPTSPGSQAASLATGLRNTLYTDYTFNNSKWTVGHFSVLRGNLFSSFGNGKGNVFDGLFSIHGNYQFTEKLALYLWSDMIHPKVSRAGETAWDAMNFQAGVSWDVTKAINLNPYVQVFPGYLSLASTSINMVLTANIF